MDKQNTKMHDRHSGSALILVVVVTVLLAVVGVMFLMISRAGEAQSGAVVQSKDLSAAVDTVVNRINDVLVDDLFGQRLADTANNVSWTRDEVMVNGSRDSVDNENIFSDEPWDCPGHAGAGDVDDSIDPGLDSASPDDDIWLPGQMDDFWLASLEPRFVDNGPDGIFNTDDDEYEWLHITDLWGQLQGTTDSLYYQQFTPTDHIYYQNTRMRWIDPDRTDEATHKDYGWHTSALWDKWQVSARNVKTKIIKPKDRMDIIAVNVNSSGSYPAVWEEADIAHVNPFGARADADGDGVADSRWVQIPNLTTSHGEPVFAAVRIIDNCAMLNLNAAMCFDGVAYDDAQKKTPFVEEWKYWDEIFALEKWHDNTGNGSGRYLTEINYLPFLRGRDRGGDLFSGSTGGDFWYNLMDAKGLFRKQEASTCPALPGTAHYALLNIDNSIKNYSFFDISEEVELRNRYMVTSRAEARFERHDVANYTLDSGGGDYAALSVPRDGNNPISRWYLRVNPASFDRWDAAGNALPTDGTYPLYWYDRRHVCTFYSFDRTLRTGQAPLSYSDLINDGWTRQQIAATKQSIFWYPLLQSQLTADQIVNNQRLFWPVGPVTTDIASPDEMLKVLEGTGGQPYNNPETRRRILHLLFAFREYFYQQNGKDVHQAALSAAQVVANIIDYSDDDAVHPTSADRQGPFYNADYDEQANADCTYINEDIIQKMITEATSLPAGTIPFGLETSDFVFGYERQPFISEVYVQWDDAAAPGEELKAFAIELLNPYESPIDITDWQIKVGSLTHEFTDTNGDTEIPAYNPQTEELGRLTLCSDILIPVDTGAHSKRYILAALTSVESDVESLQIELSRPLPVTVSGTDFVPIDKIPPGKTRLLFEAGEHCLQRDDENWKFVTQEYEQIDGPGCATLGADNTASIDTRRLQLAVPDDGRPLQRWHELETLAVQGNGPVSDPNAITYKLSDPNNFMGCFDFVEDADSAAVLNYICTINRPDKGSLPGRININTAPVHVIAAAIPPSLVDPEVAGGGSVEFSALEIAQAVVDHRETKPFTKLSDLLDVQVDADGDDELDTYIFQRYYTDGLSADENVGSQSINNDVEERDWILSNLANKFTVRSDTFTAYILVRLGIDGPQRRMIAIFDRSQVWDMNDRPRLVALHPVPDPK